MLVHGRPRSGSTENAEQRPHRKPGALLEPPVELAPGPGVHPDLAPLVALPVPNDQRTGLAIQVGLEEGERLADPKTGAPHHD